MRGLAFKERGLLDNDWPKIQAMLTHPLFSCVILNKMLNLSVSQFPHRVDMNTRRVEPLDFPYLMDLGCPSGLFRDCAAPGSVYTGNLSISLSSHQSSWSLLCLLPTCILIPGHGIQARPRKQIILATQASWQQVRVFKLLFYFFSFILLVGGQLLYNIEVGFVIH